MRIHRLLALVTAVLLVGAVGTASAQNYGTDARKIAMGGQGGDSSNIASGMVDKASPYTAIVVPFGLFQILKGGFDKFDPNSDDFDPVKAIEDATNPIHYTFGRGTTDTGQEFIHDLTNGNMSQILTNYAGFRIPTSSRAQGVAMPQGGGTIKFSKNKTTGAFQGIYFGAGPYFGFDTNLAVAEPLATILSAGAARSCAPCNVDNVSRVMAGMAITLGYRGHVALKSSASPRDGVYVAYNYHIIRGFRYLDATSHVQVDTDATGKLITPSVIPSPGLAVVTSLQAKKGTGHASDIGVVIVRNFFEVGFGINGIGNRVDWTDFEPTQYALGALFNGSGVDVDFGKVAGYTNPITALQVTVPIVISESLAFQAKGWGFMGALAQKKAGSSSAGVVALGYDEKSFHGGVERKVGPFWLRGGGRYSRDKWDPTYGFGIGNKIALDFGFYGTHANLEGKRQTTMAVSVRFNHTPKPAGQQ
jgi:hypothetical protein